MEINTGQEITQGNSEQEILGLIQTNQISTFEVMISNGWTFKISKSEHETWVEVLNATYSEELSFGVNNDDDLKKIAAVFDLSAKGNQ